MSPAVRGGFEELFGAGFAEVRVHEDALPQAASGAGRIACAHGSDLAFAPGAYVPGSGWGREIIGHELAHVLQQRYGRVRPGGFDPALEAEAIEAGRRVAGGRPVRIPGGPRRGRGHGRAVAQFYAVHPAAPGAPFVVAGGGAHHAPVQAHDSFIGQVKAGGGSSFMTGAPPTVRLAATNPAAVTLRVSGNNEIAIEDCDLGLRQPKCFYATQAVIDASNNRLTLVGSAFRLVRDPVGPNQQRITVGGNTLYRVLPQDVASGVTGTAMQCVQPCNQMIAQVIGEPAPVPRFETDPHVPPAHLIEYNVARALVPPPLPAAIDGSSALAAANTARPIAVAYGAAAHAPTPAFTGLLQQYGINQFAAPGVGEGYLTAALTDVVPGAALTQGTYPTHTDHYRPVGGLDPVLLSSRSWGDHWAGVVAADGTDVVTLENYARNGEDGVAGADARYYFQMYQTDPAAAGTTWHTAWTSTPMVAIPAPVPVVAGPHLAPTHQPATPGVRSFANPITLRMARAETRWDTIANALYGGVAVNTIKNDHNLIPLAADADAEIRQVLKGLRYANVRLAAQEKGDPARIHSWALALNNAVALHRFEENTQALLRTHGRIIALLAL
ncbi:eCIS core domain-containing protein [Streptomyces sp. NPDC001858]